MHILYVVPYTPTPIRTRPYNLLRGLALRGCSVTLATLWQNQEEQATLAEWEKLGVKVVAAPLTTARSAWNAVCALPGSTPLQASFCWQPALLHLIEPRLANRDAPFEAIHVEHLRGARFGLALKSALANQKLTIPIVWDSVDCISYLFEQTAQRSATISGRLMARLDLGRTRRYEGWLTTQFDRVLVTSQADKDALERAGLPISARVQAAPITVLANGVDLAYFRPNSGCRRPGSIVFSGKMSYHANATAVLLFAQQILPLIWRQRPDATLTIVGHNPPAAVRRLARDARIVVTGSVRDIRPFLQQASVAVAPMPYGAGIQNKVLEAMACGAPVVASARAVAALKAQAGEHLLVAETAHALADAVIQVLNDSALSARMSRAGRRYVEEHHDWTEVVADLESIYHDVAAGNGDVSHERKG